jgi:hypothetical protein
MNHDESRAIDRRVHEISARFIGDLIPDSLHGFDVAQEKFRAAHEIHNEAKIPIREHPLDNGVLSNLSHLSAVGSSQRIQT